MVMTQDEMKWFAAAAGGLAIAGAVATQLMTERWRLAAAAFALFSVVGTAEFAINGPTPEYVASYGADLMLALRIFAAVAALLVLWVAVDLVWTWWRIGDAEDEDVEE